MRISTILFISVLLTNCSEKQVFDTTFIYTLKESFVGYCPQNDNQCSIDLSTQLNVCLDEINYESLKIFEHLQDIDFSTSLPDKKHMQAIENLSLALNPCLIEKMGGEFVDNLKNGHSSMETNVVISSPSDSYHVENGTPELLMVFIKKDFVWINKEQITIDKVKSTAVMHLKSNPNARAVIFANKESATSDLVSVMDQLKSAGIEKINISKPKNDN